MKKLIIFCIGLCCTFIAGAQVKCSSGCIDLDITFKRVVINGNNAIIDFVLTNYSNKEMKVDMDSDKSRAYDDEGNCYLAKHFRFDIANTESNGGILPPETPVKLRCYISDINEYSTEFIRLEMSYFLNCYNYFTTAALNKMSVKNIPFSRD